MFGSVSIAADFVLVAFSLQANDAGEVIPIGCGMLQNAMATENSIVIIAAAQHRCSFPMGFSGLRSLLFINNLPAARRFCLLAIFSRRRYDLFAVLGPWVMWQGSHLGGVTP